MAEAFGFVNRRGAWYSYDGDNLGQGRDNIVKYLEENPDFAASLDKLMREKLDIWVLEEKPTEEDTETEEKKKK